MRAPKKASTIKSLQVTEHQNFRVSGKESWYLDPKIVLFADQRA